MKFKFIDNKVFASFKHNNEVYNLTGKNMTEIFKKAKEILYDN